MNMMRFLSARPAIAVAALLAAAGQSIAGTQTVTSTADTDTPGTLRYALNQVNNLSNCSLGAHTINFALTGTAPFKITPATALPPVTCSYGLLIDGTTQTGWSQNTQILTNNANIVIEIDGAGCSGCNGLSIQNGNVTVKGLAIHSFSEVAGSGGAGVLVSYGPAYIEGNYIGTDASGETARPNKYGVKFEFQGYGTVGKNTGQGDGNLISGNSGPGIWVGAPLPAMAGNEGFLKIGSGPNANVYYNQIGIPRSGGALGNGGGGVVYMEASSNYDNTVASNVITNNTGPGVQLRAGNKVHLQANRIWNNTQTAFDLGSDGNATDNDAGDVDSGPNDLFNKPTITAVEYDHATCTSTPCTRVSAELKAAGSGQVRFDFFRNDSSPAKPEGKFYMGPSIATMTAGVATVSQNFIGISASHITATASFESCGVECGVPVTSEYSYPKTAGPTAMASFSASSAAAGSQVAYNVVVSNPNAFVGITGLSVAVTTPTNLKVASAATQGDCASGGFAPVVGANSASVSGASIAASGTCTFTVTVYANTVESFTMSPANVTISSDAGGAVILSPSAFTGTSSPPTLQLFVTSPMQAGSSTPLSIAVSRTAGQPNYNTMTVSLSLPGGGTIATVPVYGCPPGTGSAATGGGVIAASNGSWSSNGVCEFVRTNVTFPTSGTHTVSIAPGAFTWRQGSSDTTFSNAAAVTANVIVNTPPAVSLSPASFDFGSVAAGTTASTSITLANTGGSALSISSFSMAAGTPTFSVIGGAPATTCAATLAAGASCTMGVQFSPPAVGTYTGNLSVQTNASGSPHTVSLSGTGAAPAVSLAVPASFGNVPVGTTSTITGTLTNTGNAALSIASLATSGAPFGVGTCPSSLAAGATCTFPVTFAPTAPGAQAGQLTLVSNASGSPHTASLAGTGTQPAVSFSPSPANFGSVEVNAVSTANITLTNPGLAPLAISALTVTGTHFTKVSTTCPTSPSTLASTASCTVLVAYSPTATGPHSGQLTLSSNAPGNPHSVALSGTGTAPGVSLAPSPVIFGNVPVGGTAASTLNLSNTGTATLLISGIVTTGTYFTNATNCATSLAAGATCQIFVTYAPLAAGSHTGQVSVTTNAGAGPVVAPLSGTGAVPVLTLSASSADFGSQTVGTASLVQAITVTNSGGAPLDLSAIGVTGDFNFTGCPTPLSLAPGASCTLSIKFVPTQVGARSGSISIGSNAAGSPHAIALSGNGTPVPVPGIALAPGSAAFGAIVTGTSGTQVLVLSNPGTAPLAISSIAVTGAGFSQTNTCPASLVVSASCNIAVTFAPTVAGAASGQLDIVSNAAPSPLTAALSGSGLPATTPGITFSASSVAFPSQFVGTTSASQAVTLTSSGTAPLVIAQVTGSGDFAFSGCGPSTLAPNATCAFSITFRPQSVGALTGSIVVTSNASGSPHTIALSGNGASLTAPDISLSPSAFGFDTLRIGRSATLVSRLTNTGAAQLTISQIQVTGSFFTQANDCPATIAVGGFCDISVTYAPAAAGAHSGQLLVHSNAIPSPFVAAMSGTGILVPPPFLATSGPVSFGQQVTGTTTRRTLVLTNTGGSPLNISSMAVVGSGAFGVEGGCGPIAPEASCSLTITFLPTGINTFNARLDIGSNHSGGTVQVQLSGQGVALPQPDLDFSVGALGYGTQAVNTTAPGAPPTVRLTNIGGAPVTISALRSTLPDFVIPPGTCVGTLAPRAFCDVSVTFRPIAPGPRIASLVVDSSPSQSDSVSLIGTGCRQSSGLGRNQSPARLCSP